MKCQLTRDRVRLQSQVECLLEEPRIKLSSVISDLLGVSGHRILRALAKGETDPARLAALGDERLRCGQAALIEALTGQPQRMHQQLLSLYLDRIELIDRQVEKLNQMIALGVHRSEAARLLCDHCEGCAQHDRLPMA